MTVTVTVSKVTARSQRICSDSQNTQHSRSHHSHSTVTVTARTVIVTARTVAVTAHTVTAHGHSTVTCCPFSSSATITRGTASAVAFWVCTWMGGDQVAPRRSGRDANGWGRGGAGPVSAD